jgi:hypothetical protein
MVVRMERTVMSSTPLHAWMDRIGNQYRSFVQQMEEEAVGQSSKGGRSPVDIVPSTHLICLAKNFASSLPDFAFLPHEPGNEP